MHGTPSMRRGWMRLALIVTLAVITSVASAAAETLLMPNRDFLMGASEVVWGVSTQANGTAYTIDFGDGATSSGTVADRSYIAFNHTYALPGTFTVTLTVGGQSATTQVRAFNAATLTAADLRTLNINRAIQDGLRWLWVSQENRAGNFPDGNKTNWGHLFSGWRRSFTALVVLAFENHGYFLPNSDAAPTGLYEKYIVQRGMNYIADTLSQRALAVQPAGDPCVGGVEPAPCVGLYNSDQEGYSTALSALPLAGSNALNRHVPAGIGSGNGGFVAGKTLKEVLQRLMNSIAWGQNDGTCVGRGGWIYSFSNGFCQQSDGSTVGWDVLALLDAAAGGVVEPAFVKTEFQSFALPQGLNTDGTFDYRANNDPGSPGGVGNNMARSGIGLQGLYYVGRIGTGDPQVAAGRDAINSRWTVSPNSDYLATCGNANFNNKGCAYAMFNVFKGLKLQGIASLPNAPDWYGEYQDWLVSNQSNPTSTGGGNWVGGSGKTSMAFSCCADDQTANSAIALLILSSSALIAPDPGLFATIGLSHTHGDSVNPVGTDHSITATARSASGAPIPGVTITITVVSGPNAGKEVTGVSNVNGEVLFVYHDDGGAGTDRIQAFIGALGSNVLNKVWTLNVCDVDNDGDVDNADLAAIRAANNTNASGVSDPRDANKDGKINVSDFRFCQQHLTK